MKKTILTIVIVAVILLAVAGGAVWYFLTGGGSYIGSDAAKNAALADAGLSVTAVRELESDLEREAGTVWYEVSFTVDNVEYDYAIAAVTGEVLNVQTKAAHHD